MALRILITYVVTLVVLLAMDGAYLTVVAGPAFRAELGDILLARFRLGPAITFYLAFTAGLLVFGSTPLVTTTWNTVALRAALLGLLCYGTYDLTNWATLRPWTWRLVAMDLAWGTLVSATAATLGSLGGTGLLRLFSR